MACIEGSTPETARRKSNIRDLPTELLISIAEFLCLEDLQNCRLVCSQWRSNFAHLLLAAGLALRPDRDDMSKLQNISLRPDLAAGVTQLKLYAGDMDLEQLDIVFRNYDRHYGSNLAIRMERLKEQRGNHLNFHDLSTAFKRFFNLKSLTVSSVRHPFAHDVSASRMMDVSFPAWKFFWAAITTTMRQQTPDVATEIYRSAILALQHSPSQIEKLDLDMIPLECFADMKNPNRDTVDIEMCEKMRNTVERVKELRLSFVGFGLRKCERPAIGHAIAEWLGSMQHVRSLDLTWNLEENVDGSLWSAWSEQFYDSSWPFLHSLRLRNAGSSYTKVFNLLQNHSSTLRWLQLSGEPSRMIGLERSHKEMLMDIRKHLNLEKLEYNTNPNYKKGIRIYQDDWTPISDSRSKPGVYYKKNTQLLEDFVIRGAAWPMEGADPDEFGIWSVREPSETP